MQESNPHKPQPMTLTQFILENQSHHPKASGDLSILLHAIEIASKYVSAQVRAAGLFNLYGTEGGKNASGDEVKKLDVLANEAFITSLKRSKKVCIMASEENEEPIIVEGSRGKYCVAFDPLDGSSNIDANVSIGTIFGIFPRKSEVGTEANIEDLLQPGKNMVASGYTMYGSATILVLSCCDGVNGFTLDTTAGEFVLTHPNITLQPKGKIYSVNEGNTVYWHQYTKDYVEACKQVPFSLRYIGSMVADVHRTLNYGGIFMYPADVRKGGENGKLRLLYESAPMALLTEMAGGKASTGTQRILDIVPTSIHERCPVFLGCTENVEELEALVKEN